MGCFCGCEDEYLKIEMNLKIWAVNFLFSLKSSCGTLTCMPQWVGHRLANQTVTGSIPSQGTGLGCGFIPQLGA